MVRSELSRLRGLVRWLAFALGLLALDPSAVTAQLVITHFDVLTGASTPAGIAVGPDGNLWFTENAGNKIGRITPAGAVQEFTIPAASSEPVGITAGPDGNLWFVGPRPLGRQGERGAVALSAGRGGRSFFAVRIRP